MMLLYIDMGDLIRLITECISIESEVSITLFHSQIIDALNSRDIIYIRLLLHKTLLKTDDSESWFKCKKFSLEPLTISERRHVTDVCFGIIALLLRVQTKKEHLAPLLYFISFSMELEWTASSREVQENSKGGLESGVRKERFLTSKKSASLLLYLLQYRPAIPGLFQSFKKCVDDPPSWILCCFVNR